MTYDDVRKQIHEACMVLNDAGLISGSSGNVSVRLEPNDGVELFAITPSSIPYRRLQPEQIVIINGDREVVDGNDRPSVEVHLHVATYRARPDVGAVVHSHSVYASALAVAGHDLPPLIDEQIVTLGGGAVCAEWGMSGSEDLANKVVTALDYRRAAFLRSHGAVGLGKTLEDALEAAFLLERMSHIYILAKGLGNIEKLPDNVVELEIKFYKMKQGLPTE